MCLNISQILNWELLRLFVFYVPNLRFSEFTDSWLKRRFDEIADFYKGTGISKDQLSLEGNECILYGELYTTYKTETIDEIKSKTNIDTKGLFFGKKNDVIIPASGETPIDIATSCCVCKDNILFGGDLNIIRLKTDNGSFISCQLNGKRKIDIAKIAQGASIVHLHNDDLKKIYLYTPIDLKEQTKIVELFTLIDKRIRSQSKIIEDYKTYKNRILHTIYNSLESDNRIKLNDICSITTGKLDANEMNPNGKYKFFTCAREDYYINTYSFEGESLIISGNGEVGLIKYFNGKFDAYQRTYVLQNFTINPLYVKFALEIELPKKIYKEKNVGAMPYIVLSTLSNIMINIPYKETIEKIAKLVTSIDKKIAIEEKILNDYISQKKYLLSNMFI